MPPECLHQDPGRSLFRRLPRPMQWTDEGVVLGVRKHGESSVILELMTREHGRHLGLVHGGRSKTLQAVLQPGNTVQATWRARLDEHLDRKSTRLNSSHANISYAVFCLKKKK